MPSYLAQLGVIQNGFWPMAGGGLPPYTPPLMPVSARPWMAHLYNNDWSFRASLGAIIGQRPVIKQTLNSGFQPVTIELPTLNTTIQPGNIIVITEEGGDATGTVPAGTPVIGGLVEQVPDTLQVSGWKHQITITPFVAELGDAYLNKNYTVATDVAQMVRDAVAQTNHLRVTPYSCPNTGVTAIYNFSYAPCLEVVDHARLVAGVNWSWFVDAIGVVWFQPINVGTPGQSPSLGVDTGSVQLTSANAPGGFGSIALASFKAAGAATPALVGALGAFTIGNTTIVSPTFGQATKAGDLLVAWLGCGSIDPVTTAAGWAKVVATDGNSSKRSVIWAKANCSAGETAPSFTAGGGIETLFAQLGEFSGVASLAYVDNTAVASPFANPMSITAPNPDVATSDLVLLASGWVLSGSATATFQESMSGGRSAVHAGDSGGTSVGRHSSFAYGLAAPTTPAVSVPAMFTVKPTDYTSFQTNGGDISGLKNFCLVVGGISNGSSSPALAAYTNPTSQSKYGLRAVQPPISVPGIADQRTLNSIALTVGSIYDRVINRVTIELPAYANRILLGQPGGSTMRYFSPSKYPLTESETGAGTYSATYVVLDVETDGIQQKVTIGDVPASSVSDVSYMTDRLAAKAIGLSPMVQTPFVSGGANILNAAGQIQNTAGSVLADGIGLLSNQIMSQIAQLSGGPQTVTDATMTDVPTSVLSFTLSRQANVLVILSHYAKTFGASGTFATTQIRVGTQVQGASLWDKGTNGFSNASIYGTFFNLAANTYTAAIQDAVDAGQSLLIQNWLLTVFLLAS